MHQYCKLNMKNTHCVSESDSQQLSVCRRRSEECTWRKKYGMCFQLVLLLPRLTLLHLCTGTRLGGVRGGYLMIMSNRLPPLPSLPLPFFPSLCPRLSLSLSLNSFLPPSSSSTDIRSGCAIIQKGFERNPWQPPSREPRCPSIL